MMEDNRELDDAYVDEIIAECKREMAMTPQEKKEKMEKEEAEYCKQFIKQIWSSLEECKDKKKNAHGNCE